PNTMSDIFLAPIGDRETRFDIPAGHTTVGRKADSNIVLSNPSISRLHALFQRHGRVVWLTDLNSTNGTYVNGRRLESNQRVMLYAGDRIGFSRGPGFDADHHLTRRSEFVVHGNWMSNLMFEDDEPDIPSMKDVPPTVPPAASRSGFAVQGHVGFRPSVE